MNVNRHEASVSVIKEDVQYRFCIACQAQDVYRWVMSLVQLESFVAVAEEGHVGRAARRLRVSQPPLTRRIRSLEDELGVSLFLRTSKGMRLSPQGTAWLPQVREVLAQLARLRECLPHDRGANP
ncbi:MAG: LysR family transcriptional regulator [Deltaproteobacteria bacterium]|nr:LysR family transcriptional regulator [Deltaproteobacteria bacterium]